MRYTREEYAPLDVRAAWPAVRCGCRGERSRSRVECSTVSTSVLVTRVTLSYTFPFVILFV